MGQLFALTGRNMKIYYRDRGAVFFSLLSMFITIGLMIFFLGDSSISAMQELLAQFPGRDSVADEKSAENLIYMWTCAGIISINAVTVTLAVYSAMIKDRVNGIINSIYTAPISRGIIAGGYIMAAWAASIGVCMLTVIIVEMIGVSKGMEMYSLQIHLELLFMVVVNSFTYAAIMYVLALLAKTEGAWSGIGTVIGTLVGFLGGIYLPLGGLSEMIGNLLKVTPILYGTALFRNHMMKEMLEETFEGIPAEVMQEYCEYMGIQLQVMEHEMSRADELLVLFVCGVIFLFIGIGIMKFGKKTDR